MNNKSVTNYPYPYPLGILYFASFILISSRLTVLFQVYTLLLRVYFILNVRIYFTLKSRVKGRLFLSLPYPYPGGIPQT